MIDSSEQWCAFKHLFLLFLNYMCMYVSVCVCVHLCANYQRWQIPLDL